MTVFAVIFPGQGSQAVGMLAKLAENNTIVEATFTEASDVLGYDLWQRVQQGPTEELNKTWQTQPALLASSVAIWRIWNQSGGRTPTLLAGHSLGEYSALVCSGSLDFTAAIKLVELRGKLMQEAVLLEHGAMSAIIGLDKDSIVAACKQAEQGQVVSLASFNSPDQIVIAGHKEAVKRAEIFCKEAAAITLPLPISVPSHCLLMKPAAEKLVQTIKEVAFVTPKIPVINNVDVRAEKEPAVIRRALGRQLYNPVRWTETIEYFVNHGVDVLLEFGPGKVLTRLTRRICKTLSSTTVNDPDSLNKAIKY